MQFGLSYCVFLELEQSMLQKTKERTYLFDNIKAILIFLVVACHFLKIGGSFDPASAGGFFYLVSFSFIMQGFIFISGYFSKNTLKCRQGAVKSFLIPYLVLMPIMYFIRLLLFGKARFLLYLPTHSLWFLLVLFAYRYWLHDLKQVRKIGWISLLSFFISGCIPFFGEPLALGRIFSYFLFFYVGFLFQWKDIERIRAIGKPYIFGLLALLTGLSVYLTRSQLLHEDAWQMKYPGYLYGMSISQGLASRLLILLVSCGWLVVLFSLIPNRKLPFSGIGRHTMTIFVFQIPVRYLVKKFSLPGHDNLLTYGSCLLLSFLVVYVFSRPSIENLYNKSMDAVYRHLWVPVADILKKKFQHA